MRIAVTPLRAHRGRWEGACVVKLTTGHGTFGKIYILFISSYKEI